jgi:hypothetical protein
MQKTPMQAMEQGLPMTEARQMPPDALTYDDCRRLREAEYPQYVIADRYSMSIAEFYEKLKEFGLKRNGKSWDFRAQKTEPVTRLTPGDLTREQAARMLLDNVSKPDIKRKYGFPNDPALYLKLEQWGLHKKGLPPDFKAKQEETKRMAAAVLEEIEHGEKSAIKWHEDKVKSDVIYGADQEPDEAAGNVTTATAAEFAQDLIECTPGWIPETPISEAVHQAKAAGEIKVETVERPAPEPSGSVKLVIEASQGHIAETFTEANKILTSALSPAIDLSTMIRFTPNNCTNQPKNMLITITNKNTVRLCAGLIVAGPEAYQNDKAKFVAGIWLDPDGRRIVIKPGENGYRFNGSKSIMKKCNAASVSAFVAEKVALPAVYQAEWNERERAWVGRLVEKAGVA